MDYSFLAISVTCIPSLQTQLNPSTCAERRTGLCITLAYVSLNVHLHPVSRPTSLLHSPYFVVYLVQYRYQFQNFRSLASIQFQILSDSCHGLTVDLAKH